MQRRTKGVTLSLCLEKAYDRLPRGELRKSGGVEKYLRMIQGMYKDSEMCGAGQCEEYIRDQLGASSWLQ